MKTTIILIAIAVCLFNGAHGYAADQPEKSAKGNDATLRQVNINNENYAAYKSAKVISSKLVKDIWKDMVSYDRFGNEITPRARQNMRDNEVLQSSNSTSPKPEFTEGVK